MLVQCSFACLAYPQNHISITSMIANRLIQLDYDEELILKSIECWFRCSYLPQFTIDYNSKKSTKNNVDIVINKYSKVFILFQILIY